LPHAHGGVVAVVPAGSRAMGSSGGKPRCRKRLIAMAWITKCGEAGGPSYLSLAVAGQAPLFKVATMAWLGARVSSYLGGPGKGVAEDDRTSL
jgi:hypothetical protein